MAHASQPSALFQFFTVAVGDANQDKDAFGSVSGGDLSSLLVALPAAVPAMFACLSAGMQGSRDTFNAHVSLLERQQAAAEGGDDRTGRNAAGVGAGSINREGHASPILAATFAFVENFLA